MGDPILLAVDLHGEWVESATRYTWRSKGGETVPIQVSEDVTYNELVETIISDCELDCDKENLSISYMLSLLEKQKAPPSKIKNDRNLRLYLSDKSRPVLRVSIVESLAKEKNPTSVEQCDQGENNKTENPLNMYILASELVAQGVASQSDHNFNDETGFYKGLTFKDKRELIVSLKLAALKRDFRFIKVKHSKFVYSVKCIDKKCKWRLRAMKLKTSDRFYITQHVNLHTCGAQHIKSHHPHASAEVIGEYMKHMFVEGKGSSTKDIKKTVLEGLGCEISYWKCWKGSEIARSLTRGTPEHGYAVLDAYSYMLKIENEGSKTALKLDDSGRFKYFFVSFGAWIRGFHHMRKVISIDGTHLKGKYGGVMLSAVAQDTENHIFPVAFCIVDVECDASYHYFFEQMLSIVPNTSELCIISDRHPSISKVVANIYTEAHHGICMRHLAENVRVKFQCGDFLSKFYIAAKAYRTNVFADAFKDIKNLDVRVAKYLEDAGFHRWSRAYFPGNRYDVMTTNISESINAMFLEEREFPITAIFDSISRRFAQIFHERRIKFINSSNIFVGSAEKKITENKKVGNRLLVHRTTTDKFTIIGDKATEKVNLRYKTCTCREFDLDKIPCPHAMAALRAQFGADYGMSIYEYSSPYYKVDSYLLAYAEPTNPVADEEFWKVPPEILERKILPPFVERTRGRKKTKRIPSIGEVCSRRKNKCSFCKRVGHKKTTCPAKRRVDEGTSHSMPS